MDSGFHAVDSGFRVLDSGFQHSGFRIPKRAGFHLFSGFNAFLRTSFSCSNLAIMKDVVRRHITSLFSFSISKITGRNVLQFRKGLCYNDEGDKHRITAKKRGETPTSQFKVLSHD